MSQGTAATAKFYQFYKDITEELKSQHDITDDEINTSIGFLRYMYSTQPWNTNEFYKSLSFKKLSACCGYLLRYATCHSAVVRHVSKTFMKYIQNTDHWKLLAGKDIIQVVAIGGGPGNDLVGFCYALKEMGVAPKTLVLTVIDLNPGWKSVFERVVEKFDDIIYEGCGERLAIQSSNSSYFEKIFYRFITADVSKQPSRFKKGMIGADVVILTKVLSSVSLLRKVKILKNVMENMKHGALLLFIDTGANSVLEMANTYNVSPIMTIKKKHYTINDEDAPGDEMIKACYYELCACVKISAGSTEE